jgi:hypothetical protein
MDRMTDPRYIIVGEDGHFAILGRCVPTIHCVAAATCALQAVGKSGWIARASDSLLGSKPVDVVEVEALGPPGVSFLDAVEALMARRTK